MMKLFHVLSTILRSKEFLKIYCPITRTIASITINPFKYSLASKKIPPNKVSKFLHTDSDNEELYEDISIVENEVNHNGNIRNIMFKNYHDDIIAELNSCVSVEQVLNLVRKYKNMYKDRHILQTILVLTDLQRIYFQFNGFTKATSNMFLGNLRENEEFDSVLECIQNELDDFDPNYLTYIIFYLNKLGISVEDKLMQNVALRVRDNLLKNFFLDQCSRFLTVIFSEKSVRPYYLSLPIAPLVINHIGKHKDVGIIIM